MELIQFYLTPTTDSDIELRIKQPGAVNHARFMGQSIYYLKLKILENHTDIQARASVKKEVDSLADFIALFYGRLFLTQTLSPAEAPRADLVAIEEMKMSKQHDKVVAKKFLKSMMNHG